MNTTCASCVWVVSRPCGVPLSCLCRDQEQPCPYRPLPAAAAQHTPQVAPCPSHLASLPLTSPPHTPSATHEHPKPRSPSLSPPPHLHQPHVDRPAQQRAAAQLHERHVARQQHQPQQPQSPEGEGGRRGSEVEVEAEAVVVEEVKEVDAEESCPPLAFPRSVLPRAP